MSSEGDLSIRKDKRYHKGKKYLKDEKVIYYKVATDRELCK